MTTSERRVLELALLGLETERARIDQEVAEIRQRLGRTSTATSQHTTALHGTLARTQGAPNKGKRMSAEQKKKISRAMKARWAARQRGNATKR
jgi:hypothetical protein